MGGSWLHPQQVAGCIPQGHHQEDWGVWPPGMPGGLKEMTLVLRLLAGHRVKHTASAVNGLFIKKASPGRP